MHILHAMFIPGCAGTERAFIDWTRALVATGNTVTALIHREAPLIFAQELELPNVRVMRTSWVRGPGGYKPFQTVYYEILLNEIQPDIVIAHSDSDMFQLGKAALGRYPFVTVAHTTNVSCSLESDATLAVSTRMMQRLQEAGHPADRIFHMPHMIDVPPGPLPLPPSQWHEPPVIGVLSRLSQEKGVDIFLDALHLLRSKGLPFRALIGGDGDEEERLRHQAEQLGLMSYVDFRGWVTDKDAFFKEVDIFCLPSREETFGLVLLEAALRARPIVATDCDGACELFLANGNALVVPAANAEALARGLEACLSDKAAADLRSQQAQHQIIKRHAKHLLQGRLNAMLRDIARAIKPGQPGSLPQPAREA